MPRRRPRPEPPKPTTPAIAAPLNTPFAALKQSLKGRGKPAPPAAVVAKPVPPPAPVEDDGALLDRAMAGVKPLTSRARIEPPTPASEPRTVMSEEAEALAALADLVSGETHFDVTDTREYLEGAVVGLDPGLVRKLRRGDFVRQAHLDLHGMIADEARPAVDRFLLTSVQKGLRCVLIVHGKGLNSKDHTPVLKEKLKGWLSRGQAAVLVLAFTSARPHDGGAGALYVLWRRDRRRRPIRVTEGSPR